MSAILLPTAQFLVKSTGRFASIMTLGPLFKVLNSLWKAGSGLIRIAKVYVLGTRSTDCIY